ncbi:MAG: hypothetical protein RLZ28_1437 [Actinomycetota bacterium]
MLTSFSDIELGSAFFRGVWGGTSDVIPADVAIASGHAGGYFAATFDGAKIVAASYGFLGEHNGRRTLHSHATASTVAGAGFDLKRHQRDWALAEGLEAITWTFDPLVRRNCYFNFVKLGAVAVEYLENFYGEMHDELNRGDESDRFLALLTLGATTRESSLKTSAIQTLLQNRDNLPISVTGAEINLAISGQMNFAIELPENIEATRANLPELAKHWRVSVRDLLLPCFEQGALVTRMIDKKALVVEWPESSTP